MGFVLLLRALLAALHLSTLAKDVHKRLCYFCEFISLISLNFSLNGKHN